MDRSNEIQTCSYERKLISNTLSLFKVTRLCMLSKLIVSQMVTEIAFYQMLEMMQSKNQIIFKYFICTTAFNAYLRKKMYNVCIVGK